MQQKYFFQQQQQQRRLAQRVFEKGINIPIGILLAIKETGEGFLRSLPDCYPTFRLMRAMFGVEKYPKPKWKRAEIRASLHRLRKQGLIVRDKTKKIYRLTEAGKKYISYVKDYSSVLRSDWDGKYRLIIFDIPERKKEWRRWLVKELSLLQFQLLQKSVYIGKNPLPKTLYQTIENNGLGSFIFLLTVGEIDKKETILGMFSR